MADRLQFLEFGKFFERDTRTKVPTLNFSITGIPISMLGVRLAQPSEAGEAARLAV